jgi:hypothetical protein
MRKLALFCVKNANIFAKFFGENIFKIITSVPGHPGPEAGFLNDQFANYESVPFSLKKNILV